LTGRYRVGDKWDLGVFFSGVPTIKPGASLPGQKLKMILGAGYHQIPAIGGIRAGILLIQSYAQSHSSGAGPSLGNGLSFGHSLKRRPSDP